MGKKKFFFSGVALLLVLGLILGCSKQAANTTTQAPKTIEKVVEKTVTPTKPLPSIVRFTSTAGQNSEIGTSLANALQKLLGTKFTVETASTQLNSWLLLRSGQAELAETSTSTLLDPLMGVGDYAKPEWGPQPLRILFQGELVPFGLWTTMKTGIKTMEDLKGKRVAYFPGSSTRNDTIEAILKAHGLTYNDVKKVNFDESLESYDAVQNGTADAALGGFRTAKLTEVDATTGLWIIPFGRSADVAARWKQLRPQPLLEMKKGEFAGVKEDMLQPGSVHMVGAYNFLDEDIAYQITKGLYGSIEQIQKVPITAQWSKEGATRLPLLAAYHPGSIKFFKEVGLWTAEHEKAQQEQLQAEQGRLATWKAKLTATTTPATK